MDGDCEIQVTEQIRCWLMVLLEYLPQQTWYRLRALTRTVVSLSWCHGELLVRMLELEMVNVVCR